MRKSVALRWRVGLVLSAIVASGVGSLALFTNGGFENGNLSSWTVTTFLNPSLTGSAPYGASSIVRNTGGANNTFVVGTLGSGPFSVSVTETNNQLKVPRFGDFAAVVNYAGSSNNANALKQSTTVQSSDVDSLDGKVHIRLAYAPVLADGSHAGHQQAWFFIIVRNKSRGNAVLYERMSYAAEPGVPWKTHSGYTFTDWQIVDIAPGNASLAVGDEIELEAIASRCSPGGHAGWVYVDAFGSQIPGPSVIATAPAQVNPGGQMTYHLTARNQGTGDLQNGVVKFTVPPQTTFVSVSDSLNSCTQSAGVVTCNIGTLPVDQLHPIDIVVNVNGGASGTIAAGNYSIEGTNEPALLGPVVNTSVTNNTLVDLKVDVDNGQTGVISGQTTTYTITASNLSNVAVNGSTVTATPPAGLSNVTWTCALSGGGACPVASGNGAISQVVDLAANSSAIYTVTGTVTGASGTLSMPASIAVGVGVTDLDPSNNAAADNDVITPNSAPVGVTDTYTVAEDGVLTVNAGLGVLANDTDADVNPLTAVQVSGPTHGTLSFNADGSFVYTPPANYFGPDSFTYRANDGLATSAVTTVDLTVTPVNDAPTVDQPTNLTMHWSDGPQTITLTSLSPGPGESEPISITVTSSVPGTAQTSTVTYGGGSTGTFTITPVPYKQGPVTVTVEVFDGQVTTTRTFVVNVVPPPFYVTHIYPASGPAEGGTLVSIHGAGFTLPGTPGVTPTVLVGGVPAPKVVVESDSIVRFVTPPLPAGHPLDVQRVLPGGNGPLVKAYTPYERPEPTPTEPTEPTQPGQPEPPAPDPTNPMDPSAPTVDSDGDGIPDVWEEFYGLDPHDPNDAASDPDGDGKSNFEEFEANTHPNGQHGIFFAEGTAQDPFTTWLNFYNPAPFESAVQLTFYLDDATVVKHLVRSRPQGRLTVDTSMIAGLQNHAFGIRVEADEAVVSNRTMTWNRRGEGATAERAMPLSPTWYFAEGTTHEGLHTFLLLTNPTEEDITADVEYLVSGNGYSVMRSYFVPKHSRQTVWVNQEGPELQDQGFGTVVRASAPLVAERATYIIRDGRFEAGETSFGSPGIGTEWFFAEGSAGPFFDSFLLLVNPSDTTAEVDVRYLPDHGEGVTRTHIVGPRSRVTVPLDKEHDWESWTGLGMHVTSKNDVPIIAERAMWWSTNGQPGWEEGHGGTGLLAPALSFAMGDGVAGGPQGAATYLLVANPSDADAIVRVTIAFEDGTPSESREYMVPVGRRQTLNVAGEFPTARDRRFSARVDSLNATPIVVEESIYWSLGTGTWKTGVSLPATRLQ